MDYAKLIRLFLRYPARVFKNLNQENIAKYLHAIKHENKQQILLNIEQFLAHGPAPVGFDEADGDQLPARMSGFIDQLARLQQKKTGDLVLFVSHETTLTGAPLIVYQIARDFKKHHGIQPVFLLLKGGKIKALFSKNFPSYTLPQNFSEADKVREISLLLDAIPPGIGIKCCYVNSAESRFTLPLLKAKIPKVISLVHEMGNLYPENSWRIISSNSDHVVFPCEFVREKAQGNSPFHPKRISVKGQGLLKPEIFETDHEQSRTFVRKQLGIREDAKIVLACGTPIARKGIDLFVFTAISTLSQWKEPAPLYFIWVGDAPENYYQQWTRRDIAASDYPDQIRFLDAKEDIAPWFVGSDLFFLTSRGDPFPCVVHEALAAGLRVVGFENTGGLPEMLPPQAALLNAYGDLAGASKQIISALQDSDPDIRTSIVNYARTQLDYRVYTDYLLELADVELTPGEITDWEETLTPHSGLELPVPPLTLMEYQESRETHIRVGQREADNIKQCLQNSGYQFTDFQRILEFGCNNCRLLRWFYDGNSSRELWGCDIDREKIDWVRENMGDFINARINGHQPPLEFSNDFFDFIFAGSVFPHLDQHDSAWMQELSRITKPGGLLYLTFLDETSMEILANEPHRPIYKRVAGMTDADKIWGGAFKRVAIPRINGTTKPGEGLILSHSSYIDQMPPDELELIQVKHKAFAGFQTAYLFRKK